MIKIWGRKDSSNVQKVLWCCDELGAAYERADLGGQFGGNTEKTYLELNPNGLVPTIRDGNFILWESNTIIRYLAEKYGKGKLIPAGLEERANANRWMDWQLTTLGPVMAPLFRALVRNEKLDKGTREALISKATECWQILDTHFAKNNYAAGEEFSLGDIPLGVWVYRWLHLPVNVPEMKPLNDWYERLRARKPYQTHILIPVT